KEARANQNDLTDLPENDEDDYKAIFEGLELGTEATRTSIIDNARKSGYIELKKDVYHILPGGIYLIESLSRMNISMDKYKTSELGKALKKVFRSEISVSDSVKLAQSEISEVFSNRSTSIETDTDDGFYGDIAGVCPLCGEKVLKGRYGYYCSGYKSGCKFSISTSICGRVISKANVSLLLETGRSSKIQGFVSKKSGKTFDAYLKLESGEIKFDFSN
ncbi:MAG: topoisomerase C-terminal repeat-containing protein, partial [Clostridia bacterium]|nr:topoisomerase C-terminal repeat-containing protein [Clostridia bacterium]